MTLIDSITILIVLASAFYGYQRGLVRQATSLAGYLLGIIACNVFGGAATEALVAVNPEAAQWPLASVTTHAVAVITLFLIIVVATRAAGSLIKGVVQALHLGVFDRIGGVALCAFKYFFMLSIILNLWFWIKPSSDEFQKEHIFGNVPFEATLNLVPAVLGADHLPGDSLKVAATLPPTPDNDGVTAPTGDDSSLI